ncbi:hypothetical protein [Kitasatospora sp. NPDC090091]|uniref:hypothetical protein n=1 Tax=Kitasatospora sp. NPDC090091 TaxID=3364081 RepID=UPI00382F5FCB
MSLAGRSPISDVMSTRSEQDRTGGGIRINGVGLAAFAAYGAIELVYLDDLDILPAQVPRLGRAIGTDALHPSLPRNVEECRRRLPRREICGIRRRFPGTPDKPGVRQAQ